MKIIFLFSFLVLFFGICLCHNNFLNIRVLTMNRPKSLVRLLNSINKNLYQNDSVNLEIFIDTEPFSNKIDEKTLTIAKTFSWRFGKKIVVSNKVNLGLRKQWFRKISNSIPVLILEDDLIVADKFYEIIKKSLKFLKKKNYENIMGIALQTIEIIIKKNNCPYYEPSPCIEKHVPNNSNFFLSQFSSWGPVVFSEKWNELIDMFTFSQKKKLFHCIPGAISNKWYNMASSFAQFFMYTKGYFMMYFYTQDKLIHNFKEKGLHFTGRKSNETYTLFNESICSLKMSTEYFFDNELNLLNQKLLLPINIQNFNSKKNCFVD